ncbi:MAG: putative quorum-sensing-regulated virulence factor [Chlamydiota bacterium]
MSLRPIFYDTETTGVRPDNDRIIEIAAFDPVKKRSFCKFVNPGRDIPAEATAIHHITNEMVAEAEDFGVVGQQFMEFCDGEVVLVAHNNDAFDVHFLYHEYQRFDYEMPSRWKFFDTLKWARRYRSDLPRHALQYLREIYGIPANNAHRALDDVLMLYKVYKAMTDDLTIEMVWELYEKFSAITHMPFGKHQGVKLEDLPGEYLRWIQEKGILDKPENKDLRKALYKKGLLEKSLSLLA